MMDYSNGWMHGSMGRGMWIWTLVSVLVVILLVVVINNQNKKWSRVQYLLVKRAVHPEMKTMPDILCSKTRLTWET